MKRRLCADDGDVEGIHCGASVALCCCARPVLLPRRVDRKPDLGYN